MKQNIESEPSSGTTCPSCGSSLPRRTLRCPLCGFHFEPLSDAERRQTGTYLRPATGLGRLMPRRVLFPVAVGILVAGLGYWFLSRQAVRDRPSTVEESDFVAGYGTEDGAGFGNQQAATSFESGEPGMPTVEMASVQPVQISGVTVGYRVQEQLPEGREGDSEFAMAALLDGNAATCFAPFVADSRRIVDFSFGTARRLSHAAITHCQTPGAPPASIALQIVTDDGSVRKCLVPSDGTGVADLGGAWSSVVGLTVEDSAASGLSLAEVVFFEFQASRN